jgi:hypothetical protein
MILWNETEIYFWKKLLENVLRNIFRVEIREYRVEIKQKKGSNSIPFFVHMWKIISKRIAAGDSNFELFALNFDIWFV